jgi:hypothetical protein
MIYGGPECKNRSQSRKRRRESGGGNGKTIGAGPQRGDDGDEANKVHTLRLVPSAKRFTAEDL